MKYTRLFGTLALALIFALLLVAIPAVPAQAASITLTPDTGEVGDTVTVTGSAFNPGHLIDIYFDGRFAGAYVTATPAGTITTSFIVPDVGTGTYLVRARNFDTQQWVDTVTFVVSSSEITIAPDNGAVGDEVEISGVGYTSGEDIIVEYDGDEVAIQSGDDDTDSGGEFEGTTIVIPESTAGEHTITVIGAESSVEAEAKLIVKPQIIISPTSGSPRAAVTVNGTGFGLRSGVTIFFNNVKVVATSGSSDTDSDGDFIAIFSVPTLESGTYNVEARDESANKDAVEFAIAISTSMGIAPVTGTAGTEVTVTGGGFSGTVTIKYDGSTVTTAAAESNGDFSATFNVPDSISGDHTITISDGVNEKSAIFTSTATIDSSPISGNVGTEVTVTGGGFSGVVIIKYGESTVDTTIADASGVFLSVFPAPASVGGVHDITVTDGTSTWRTTFTMEAVAPEPPVPLSPKMGMGIEAEAEVFFDWRDVTDPSGATYALQIASNKTFSMGSILLEKAGLTDSEYYLTEREELEPTKEEALYYWRVRAIDGASNESKWAGVGSFYIASVAEIVPTEPDPKFAMPSWALYTLIGVGGLLLFILGLWLGRRTAYTY